MRAGSDLRHQKQFRPRASRVVQGEPDRLQHSDSSNRAWRHQCMQRANACWTRFLRSRCSQCAKLEAERGFYPYARARFFAGIFLGFAGAFRRFEADLPAYPQVRRKLVERADRSLTAPAAFGQTLNALRFADIYSDAPVLIDVPSRCGEAIVFCLASDGSSYARGCGESLVPRHGRASRLGAHGAGDAFLSLRSPSRRQYSGARDDPC